MKTIISLLCALLMLPFAAAAQEKAEKQYLPEKGDFAIGFDAAPLLYYAGNIFNGTEDNSIEELGGTPAAAKGGLVSNSYLLPDYSIMGKYMLTDHWGLRANIGLIFSSDKTRGYVIDQAALAVNPLSQDRTIDSETVNTTGVSVSLGAEYRVGKKRIQGVFGGGILIAATKQKIQYSYGNGISAINQRPNVHFTGVYDNNNYRTLSTFTHGANTALGLVGNAGLEWFVAPKIALGAEINLCLCYEFGSQTYTKQEGFNTSTNKVEVRTNLSSPGNRNFFFGTESLGGALYMMFYF